MCIIQKLFFLSFVILLASRLCRVTALALPQKQVVTASTTPWLDSTQPPLESIRIWSHERETGLLDFSVACLHCSDEERRLLKEQSLSIQLEAPEKRSTLKDSFVLSINGISLQDLPKRAFPVPEIGTGFGYKGPLSNDLQIDSPLHSVHWASVCLCLDSPSDGVCPSRFTCHFFFEFLGLGGDQHPGFSIAYQQYDGAEKLEIAGQPDRKWPEWNDPETSLPGYIDLLHEKARLASVSTATFFSSFSSGPASSATAIAMASAMTTSHVTTSTSPGVPTTTPSQSLPPSQSLSSTLAAPSPFQASPVAEQISNGWSHASHYAQSVQFLEHGVEQGFSSIRTQAQHAAQAVMHTLQNMHHCSAHDAPGHIKLPPIPSHTSSFTPSATSSSVPSATTGVSPHVTSGLDIQVDWPVNHHYYFPIYVEPSSAPIKACQILSLILIIITLFLAIFLMIRRNPRLRAEIAARREERRNRRLYHHAACRHRWRTAIGRVLGLSTRASATSSQAMECLVETKAASRTVSGTAIDWKSFSEKKVSPRAKARPLPGTAGIHDGILEFRQAHHIVNTMITAEGGNNRWAASSDDGSLAGDAPQGRHGRTWSASNSSERSAPPPYEAGFEESMAIQDGFGYEWIRRNFRGSPGSSIVDTSSRGASLVDSDDEAEKD